MDKEKLLEFYEYNKDRCVTVDAWGSEARIDLQDLFKLFKVLLEENE